MVPARTEVISPSSCNCFSSGMRVCEPALRFSEAPAAKLPSLAAGTGEVTRALFASTRFVYGQGTSLHLLAVQSIDGGRAGGGVGHGDEAETAGAAGHAIVNERHFGDGAVLFEKILKIVFSCIEG